MAHVIVLKKEFEIKLKKFKAYTRFCRNINLFLKKNKPELKQKDVDKHIEDLNKKNDFKWLIVAAFDWTESLEGVDFWEKIAES